MKFKFMLIGIMLALVLCITPVAAVSGDDFEVVIDESGGIDTYTYSNVNNPDEKYTKIRVLGTIWDKSLITFKPANIHDAPVMVVDTTNKNADIYLPRSVDEWEIKYYSIPFWCKPTLTTKYLKNAGVVNLNKVFGKYIEKGLYLGHQDGLLIYSDLFYPLCGPCWFIPSV